MPTTVNPPNPSPPADDLSMPPMSVPPAEPAITGCGILLGLGVLLFAAFFAVASIYARRTRLEKTREVFGDDTITALQLADQVHLLPGEGQDFEPVELTGTPGLGHLRRALLDERHYQWDTLQSGTVGAAGGDKAIRFTLELADPTGKRVPVIRIPMELTEGWIGTPDGTRRVRVNDRVRPALRHQLVMLQKKSPKTFDRRALAEEAAESTESPD